MRAMEDTAEVAHRNRSAADDIGAEIDRANGSVKALAVVSTEVGDAADGWFAAECGVGPVVIVDVLPSVEGTPAGGFAAVGAGVGPFEEHGALVAFDLPVGAGPVRAGSLVHDAGLGEHAAPEAGSVARSIVGQHAAYGDAVSGEERLGALPERDRGGSFLVGEDLAVGQAGVVVDGAVDVAVAAGRRCAGAAVAPAGGPAEGSPAAAVGDTAELLDVHVHQVTGRGVLVAARLLPADGLAGGQIYAGQLGHAVADQHLVHRRGGHTQPAGDRRRAKTLGPPQVQDLPLHPRPGPVRAAVRPAGPVDHPRRAELPVPIGPTFRRGWADLKPLSGSTQRPPVVHDTLSKLQTAAFGQGCVSVGHEDLQVTVCVFSSSTLTRRSSTLMDLYSRVPVTNLCGQYI
jgi:hypothetical protein